jgi:lipopolysaccharide export system protein LptC
LTFHQPGESPWYIYSELGEIKRYSSAQNAPPGDAIGPGTSIHFTGQVRLSRGRDNQTLMELQGESLTIFPELKRVESNEPVIIETSSSNARAASFEFDLEQNFLQLRSSTDQRVHFIILPKTRI